MKTQSREVGAEARLWAGHAEVGHHSKAQATTDSCSMYRCDNWLFGTKQSVALDIKRRDAWTWSLGRRPCPSSVEPSPKLAPAQNALPWAASTMPRLLPSSSKLSHTSAIPLINRIPH